MSKRYRVRGAASCTVLLAAVGFTFLRCDIGSPKIVLPTGSNVLVGSGNVVQETRAVSVFDGVDHQGVGEVAIAPGGTPGVVVVADDNILPLLRTEVVGGTLVISSQPGRSFRASQPIRYLVSASALSSARLSGVGEIECVGLAGGRLRLEGSGVGGLRFTRMAVDELEVVTLGEGGVVVSGGVTRQRVTVSGVIDYNARGLRSSEAVVEMAGVASATVRVRDRLTATLGGAGCLYYLGDPVLEVTGSGCIEKLDG